MAGTDANIKQNHGNLNKQALMKKNPTFLFLSDNKNKHKIRAIMNMP